MDTKILSISQWLGSGSINIFGMPFAGKDTQARNLSEMFGAQLVAGGDILRSYHDQDHLDQLMSTGELIPSELFMKILLPFFSKPELKNKPLILSSVGRLQGEESTIVDAADKSGHPVKAVVLLNLGEDEVWKHFDKVSELHDRGQRHDDKRETLKTRIHEFQTKTVPVINYYRDADLLTEVNGSLTREEVLQEIIDGLYLRSMRAVA